MAEPGLSELISTTLRNRQPDVVDNITNNLPVTKSMKEYGAIEIETGGRTLVEPHFFDENDTVMHYQGAQPLNTTHNPTISAFEVNWKQFAGSVVIDGLEERQNSGREGIHKLLANRIMALEYSMQNFFEQDVISDGTGDGGLQVGGLGYWISKTPATGTVGGVDRSASNAAYARNFDFDTVNDTSGGAPGGAAATSALIKKYLNWCINSTTRGSDGVKVLLQGQSHFELLQDSMQALQRVVKESDSVKVGYRKLVYEGIPVFMCGGVNFGGQSQIATDQTIGVNTRFTKLRVHKNAYFTPLPETRSINQDAKVKLCLFMGNMTCSAPRLNFKMYDS